MPVPEDRVGICLTISREKLSELLATEAESESDSRISDWALVGNLTEGMRSLTVEAASGSVQGAGEHGGGASSSGGEGFHRGQSTLGSTGPLSAPGAPVVQAVRSRFPMYLVCRTPAGHRDRLGIYVGGWDKVSSALNLPNNRLIGSGFMAKGFHTMKEAAAFWETQGFKLPMPEW